MRRINQILVDQQRNNWSDKEIKRVVETLDDHLKGRFADNSRPRDLPEHLATTDRILQRWAAAPTGWPSDNPDVYRISRPVPLDDKTQEAVSDCVKAATPSVRKFVGEWYFHGVPKLMARARGFSNRQIYREWHDVLHVMRASFLASEHGDLAKLTRQLP